MKYLYVVRMYQFFLTVGIFLPRLLTRGVMFRLYQHYE